MQFAIQLLMSLFSELCSASCTLCFVYSEVSRLLCLVIKQCFEDLQVPQKVGEKKSFVSHPPQSNNFSHSVDLIFLLLRCESSVYTVSI